MNNMAGHSGFPATRAVFGAATSDCSSPLLDEQERDGDLLRDLFPDPPSLASPRMREIAQLTLTNDPNRKRVARL